MATFDTKPPRKQYDAGSHAKQPKGKSIGYTSTSDENRFNTKGSPVTKRSKGGKEIANIDKPGGSSLQGDCGMGHAGQPSGKSIGAGGSGINHMKTSGTGDVFSFNKNPSGAHEFKGTTKSGFYRLSGSKGAHMIGKRK